MTEPVTDPSPLTRRRFLLGAAGGWLLAGLAACSNDNAPTTRANSQSSPSNQSESSPAAGAAGQPFVQPNEFASAAGVLEVVLRVEANTLAGDGSSRYGLTYNGTSPGPTLRVRPGDRLQIRLENRLDEPTNLHTHGLHVSPDGDADNIFVNVAPGEDHTYVYDIPADHRSGLFWYHPHAHHTVARQVAGGLAGAIIVSDDIDDAPIMSSSQERVWVLADPPVGAGPEILNVSGMDQMMGRQGATVLVNGVATPEVTAEIGRLERWRVVNASASRYYRFAVDDHQLHVIATDGGRLGAPVSVSDVLLSPGERTEVLVAPNATGNFAVRSLSYDRGNMGMGRASGASPDISIATMTVGGRGAAAQLPTDLGITIDTPTPSGSRSLELGMGMGEMGSGMAFTIDGKIFDPNRTDIAVAANSIEQWEIRNTTAMDHPFHLHVWPFQVLGEGEISGWKDTVNVPANSAVQIVVPFTGIVGRTVYHCHILDHEDLGMMGCVEVT